MASCRKVDRTLLFEAISFQGFTLEICPTYNRIKLRQNRRELPMPIHRRAFLSRTACLCAAAGMPWAAEAAESPKVTPALSQFDYGDVQLAAGPLQDQFEQQKALYMGLDQDALLKPFRVRAGLPAPGADMGGWYDNAPQDFHVDPADWAGANWHGFIPGHSFGQYISGLARGYAVTGDPAVRTRIRDLVIAYTPTISPDFFNDYTLVAYTFDKLLVGLMDAWHFAGVEEARAAADKMTDAALVYLPEKALNRDEMAARPHNRPANTFDESYTLPENLFLAWQRGMGERYRDLGRRYIEDDTYFTPLSQGVNPLKDQHAYSHVNGLSSAAQSYLVLGDAKYLRAAWNGFHFLEQQSFATGGWGRTEGLLASGDTESLYRSLSDTHASFETPCGTYGHFKIARYLMCLTGDAHYGDSMERLLYNAMLGALPTDAQGHTFYYSDYNQTAKKTYYGYQWPCCSGTFIQLTADYGISAWMRDAGNLYVNLYVPSTVKASFGGHAVTVTQTGDYPAGDTSTLTLTLKAPARFGVKLRIPGWAGPGTRISINGKPAATALTPGQFATVERTWRDGDTVAITFDMPLRLEPLNEAHPDMVALMTGPVVLFPVEDGNGTLSRDELLSAKRDGDGWIIAADDRTVKLRTFPAIGSETYRLYTRLTA